MIEQAVDPNAAGRNPIWCELIVDPDGLNITVNRSAGCSPADAVELCRMVATKAPMVRNTTM